MTQISAIIRWLPAERGGRNSPPASADRYAAPARFESDPESALGDWSVQLSNPVSLRGNECILAAIDFIVPDAPRALLKEGERFELMEGNKVVAKGVILPQRVQVPSMVNDFELALLG